jgi:hypothetical protein
MSHDEHRPPTVKSIPVLDTGLGKELGYRDDAHLLKAAAEERAALPPAQRALAEAVERKLDEAILHGTGNQPQEATP